MQRPQHRALFQDLLKGEGAVLYHCTAGKDRTGVATALILSALGARSVGSTTKVFTSTAMILVM